MLRPGFWTCSSVNYHTTESCLSLSFQSPLSLCLSLSVSVCLALSLVLQSLYQPQVLQPIYIFDTAPRLWKELLSEFRIFLISPPTLPLTVSSRRLSCFSPHRLLIPN